jgi:hypothetical protein
MFRDLRPIMAAAGWRAVEEYNLERAESLEKFCLTLGPSSIVCGQLKSYVEERQQIIGAAGKLAGELPDATRFKACLVMSMIASPDVAREASRIYENMWDRFTKADDEIRSAAKLVTEDNYAGARAQLDSAIKYSPRIGLANYWTRELDGILHNPGQKPGPSTTPYLFLVHEGGINTLLERDGLVRLPPISQLPKDAEQLDSLVDEVCAF